MSSTVKINSTWTYVIFVALVLVGVSIIGKGAMLQFIPDENSTELASSFTSKVRSIEPTRGQIWSSDGSLLATTVSEYSLRWDTQAIQDKEEFEKAKDSLAEVLHAIDDKRSKRDFVRVLDNAVRKKSRYELLLKHLTFQEMNAFKKLSFVKKGRNKTGFVFEETKKRVKPYGSLASRTVGLFRESDNVGLELSYDSILSGRPGKQLQELIPGSVWKPMTDEFIQEPIPGLDIIATIDVHLQDVAEHALRKQLDSLNGEWGCAILMEVETGYVRAIANLGRTKDSTYSELMNYAISQSVEPGSTMKLMSIMAALEEGSISIEDTVNTGNGERTFNGFTLHDSHKGGYGSITIKDVFAKSSNVGTALGVRKAFASKPQKFLDYLNGFGLGSTLGIDLKGEGKPSIYASVKDENWSANSLTQMSIGYEVAFTPIQILAFYNAVANGGKMVRPSFVQGIKQSNGKISVVEPVVLRDNIASEHTLEQGKKMMEGVGEPGGTAYEAFKQSPYKVAGKTGTSWLWKNGVYQLNRYRASFVGYFPADKPKYSCIVVIEDPHGIYYASKVAAPVFRELADKIYATTLDIHGNNWVAKGPTIMPSMRPGMVKNSHALMTAFGLPVIPKDIGSDWSYLSRDEQSASLVAMNVREGLVPNCMGMGMRDAIQALHHAGYHYKVSGKGRVVGQGVLPGTAVKKGSTIHLQLQ
ncbi:MAG: hypothetical protein RLY35_463 [Bacteroidota bacterium]|jgi:cell division protein FtsI (penicillin-binding protein 3)